MSLCSMETHHGMQFLPKEYGKYGARYFIKRRRMQEHAKEHVKLYVKFFIKVQCFEIGGKDIAKELTKNIKRNAKMFDGGGILEIDT